MAGQSTKPPSAPASPSATTYTYAPNCCTRQTTHPLIEKTRRWSEHLEDPNWWLVISAFVTLTIIGRQTVLTRKAAEATAASAAATLQQAGQMEKQTEILRDSVTVAQRSSDAALLNAQAVINAERPWLFCSLQPTRDGNRFDVRVTNKGRTPALLLDSRIDFIVSKTLTTLPIPATYRGDTIVQNKLLLPDDPVLVYLVTRTNLKDYLGDAFPQFPEDGYILVIGQILYRDLLNNDVTVVHETRWVGWYRPGEEGDSFSPVEGIGLSSEYERYT